MKLLDTCQTVIAWSVGFNTHSDRPINTPLDIRRFKIIGVRDYQNPSGLPYLPCVSSLAPELDLKMESKRQLGIIDHKSFPVDSHIFGERMKNPAASRRVSSLVRKFIIQAGVHTPIPKSLNFMFSVITLFRSKLRGMNPCLPINNSHNFQKITEFIATSEVIVSSSYHMIFWATLMGKRVICANPFSTKFDYFKHKPVFYSGDLEKDISRTQIYPNALSEARKLNLDFFSEVKNIVQTTIKNTNKDYQYVYETTIPALLRRRQEDTENKYAQLEETNKQTELKLNELKEEIVSLSREISRIRQETQDESLSLNQEILCLQQELKKEIVFLNQELSSFQQELNEKTSLRYFAKKIRNFIKKLLLQSSG